MAKKAIAGGGAWMIAAALQVVPQTWPTLLHPHPWAVGIFILTGAAMFAYAAFEHKQPSGATNTVGGNNTGNQITAHNSTILVSGTGGILQSFDSPPAPPALLPSHRLFISGSEMPILVLILGQWSVYASGIPSVIVWVENKEADEGQYCESISGVIAVVSYRDTKGTPLGKVARAYWLNEPGSKVDLGVGDRKAILLGTVDGTLWKAYENSYEPPIRLGRPVGIPHFPNPKTFEIAVNRKLVMGVSIIDQGTGRTIKKFEVEYLDKGVHDKMVTVRETV